ncbi:type II CAAX endopeptidase family protein [Polaribacter sp. Z022]|uniref:CPBP family intramembrane glutamic endopeptidase n=1 Tax=Polaribacter sp. Z022 TaxID=2927125 RepID=UPI00202141CD|nr:type II CAAX endopeptidase family protein [Polaribacter sp. Z022]MCL7753622.1 CPBP family intramembrane metalloprotease [Polaribacter sp. Z022]
MKNLIKKYPIISKYVFAIIIFFLALFVSGLLNKGVIKQYFPYSSAICLGIATWVLLKSDNKKLSDYGLDFKIKNLKFFLLGILIGAIAFLLVKYLRALCFGETINLSSTFNYKNILNGFYIMLPMVAVEEFLFRGYLFKKTIEVSSVLKANIIFSFLFMLVHVFDIGVINSTPMIIFTVITIPIGHLLFATAFLKSKSLYFAIGIHLGNNWGTRHLVSKFQNGDSIFYITENARFDTWLSFIAFILLWNLFYLLIIFIIWKWNFNSKIKRFKKG